MAQSSPLEQALAQRRARFVAFVRGRVRDEALAEDLVQSAFARVLPSLGAADEAAATAYFYRALRNAIVDRQRRSAAESRALEALLADVGEAVQPALERRPQACQCVLAVAEGLKPEYAAALRAVEVDGASVKEYAGRDGITPNNAAVRVFRARAALKEGILAACGSCAAQGCGDCTCGVDRGGPAQERLGRPR